jgi:hypothetical protein
MTISIFGTYIEQRGRQAGEKEVVDWAEAALWCFDKLSTSGFGFRVGDWR